MEAQERHRIKTRLPRTAVKVSKNQIKDEMGKLGVEFNSDSDDEVMNVAGNDVNFGSSAIVSDQSDYMGLCYHRNTLARLDRGVKLADL